MTDITNKKTVADELSETLSGDVTDVVLSCPASYGEQEVVVAPTKLQFDKLISKSFFSAAAKANETAQANLTKEREKERAAIADAAAGTLPLTGKPWLRRHLAQEKARATALLLRAIIEVVSNK